MNICPYFRGEVLKRLIGSVWNITDTAAYIASCCQREHVERIGVQTGAAAIGTRVHSQAVWRAIFGEKFFDGANDAA